MTVCGTDNLFLNVLKYTNQLHIIQFVIIKELLCHFRRPFSVLWVLVFNFFFSNVLLSQWSKPASHVFACSLTVSNTKPVNLTWLPLENKHHDHTWHDYLWPWHDYCILEPLVPGADFENSLYAFRQSEKG